MVVVTYGYGQRIACIQVVRLFFEAEQPLQHLPYLFLAGIAIARYRLLDLPGRIFRNGYAGLHSGSNSDSLCPSELQHTLHVFPEEGRFDGKGCGTVTADELLYFLVYPVQAFIGVFVMREFHRTHFEEAKLSRPYGDEAESHQQGAWIYAQNNFRTIFQRMIF